MPISYVKKVQPEPLPTTLQSGQLTTITEYCYVLHGEARLVGELYYGEWQRAEGRSSTFVAACLIDWDQWRSERQVAEGLLAKDLTEFNQGAEREPIPGQPLGKALW